MLVAGLRILVAYLVLTERGLRTAIGVRDGFGKLLAGGLAFVLAFQCFVVAGGVTRLIPLTGLTMPFMAYGGSSLLANWVIVALLLRISDNARRPAPPVVASGLGSAAPPPVPEQSSNSATEVINFGDRPGAAARASRNRSAETTGGVA